MTRLSPTRRAFGALAIAALVLAGCSADQPETDADASDTSDTSNAVTEDPGATHDAQSDPTAAEAPVERFTEPVATTTVPASDGSGDLTVAVLGLERRGRLVVLNVTVTRPEEAANPDLPGANSFMLFGDTFRPTLIDPDNLQQYTPVRVATGDAEDETLASSGGGSYTTQPGGTMTFAATFAAPPAEVTHLDVQLFSVLPVMTQVPLS